MISLYCQIPLNAQNQKNRQFHNYILPMFGLDLIQSMSIELNKSMHLINKELNSVSKKVEPQRRKK